MANITVDHGKQITTDCVLLEVQSIWCQQPLVSTEGALSDGAGDGLCEQNLSFLGQNLQAVKFCSMLQPIQKGKPLRWWCREFPINFPLTRPNTGSTYGA